MTHVVDTHALVWFLEKSRRLSRAARAAMIDTGAEVIVPTIALAEIAYLHPRERIEADLAGAFAHVANSGNCSIYPLDEAVVERFPVGLDIHDAIIAATAPLFRDGLGKETDVITKDADITASGLVAVVW